MIYDVIVEGDAADLALAEDCFGRGAVRIRKDGDVHLLDFPALRTFNDMEQVRAAAEKVLWTVNAALKIHEPALRPLRFSVVRTQDESGQKKHYVLKAETGHFKLRGGVATLKVIGTDGKVKDPGPSLPEQVQAVAGDDPAVHRALTLWSEDRHDGAVVYKIYELIRDDCGGDDGIASSGLASKSEQSVFRGSVNRSDVLGEYARHAITTGSTMTAGECEAFIRGLLLRWIEQKYADGLSTGKFRQ